MCVLLIPESASSGKQEAAVVKAVQLLNSQQDAPHCLVPLTSRPNAIKASVRQQRP